MIELDQNSFQAFTWRARRNATDWQSRSGADPYRRICLEGFGDWGASVYRNAIRRCVEAGQELTATYRDVDPARGTAAFAPWEAFEAKSAPTAAIDSAADLLIVSTPDEEHLPVLQASIDSARAAVVEKPFGTAVRQCELVRPCNKLAIVRGIDHYPAYISLGAPDPDLWSRLGGSIARIDFALLQSNSTEEHRLNSLGQGLGFDMLPHFLALLVALGFQGRAEEVEVRAAGQHEMAARFPAETCLDLQFRLRSSQGSVLCRAIVGKGLPVDVKYLDLMGAGGEVARFDLGTKSNAGDPSYPTSRVSYFQTAPRAGAREYLGIRRLDVDHCGPTLDTSRCYDRLIEGLVTKNLQSDAAACLFDIDECCWMVSILEQVKAELGRYLRDRGGRWPSYRAGTFPVGWNIDPWIGDELKAS